MKTELRFFDVFPSVVKAGEKSKISITPNFKRYAFEDKEYEIRIVPREKRDYPVLLDGHLITQPDQVVVVAKPDENGSLVIEYDFKYEQEYRILLYAWPNDTRYDFGVYALDEDLYKTMPYRGDLHLHSNESDGIVSPFLVSAAYRELGYEFMAVTDHHRYYPSIMLMDKLKEVDSGMNAFPGEEVHNCEMGYFHIVNFNAKYSVNTLINEDYPALQKKLYAEAETMNLPEGVDAREFAFRKWISAEIKKAGGLAIFAHPYWIIWDEYHAGPQTVEHAFSEGLYDGLEVFGGCKPNENLLQGALYYKMREKGIKLAAIGSTDAHDHIPHDPRGFYNYYTLAFAESPDKIPESIGNLYSVAVRNLPGETPVAYGDYRFVKYAHFLINEFYPAYEDYTKDIGALMRAYDAYGEGKEIIEKVNKKAQDYKNKFFGRI